MTKLSSHLTQLIIIVAAIVRVKCDVQAQGNDLCQSLTPCADLESMRKPLGYGLTVLFVIISCCFRELSPTGLHLALVARKRIRRMGGGRRKGDIFFQNYWVYFGTQTIWKVWFPLKIHTKSLHVHVYFLVWILQSFSKAKVLWLFLSWLTLCSLKISRWEAMELN